MGFNCHQNTRAGFPVWGSGHTQPRNKSGTGHAVCGGGSGSKPQGLAKNYLRNHAGREAGSPPPPVHGIGNRDGLVTTSVYDANGFLSQQIVEGFSTNSYTYTNNLVLTHTDPRGLTTTNTWDNLNRLTSTAFPDGTYVSNQYSALDLTGTRDRLGHWTFYGYDSMRRKIAETNALGAVTLYGYCDCGSLDWILDPGTNLTQFYYDNQGNLTETVYADNFSVTRTLNLLKQVVRTTDSSGYCVTNIYNNQGLLIAVSNAFGLVQSTVYDVLDRATNSVDANGVSVNTTYDNCYALF